MPQAAETRAKVNTITPIKARSQPHDVIGFDGAQQVAGLVGGQHGGLALAELLARRLHGECRVVLDDAACDQVVEQHADGGHVLLEGGGRQPIGLGRVEIVADVEGADVLHTVLAAVLQEGEERSKRPAVGSARVVVVDGGAQEVLDAVARFAPSPR